MRFPNALSGMEAFFRKENLGTSSQSDIAGFDHDRSKMTGSNDPGDRGSACPIAVAATPTVGLAVYISSQ